MAKNVNGISVILPVGDPKIYGKYLEECIRSIAPQLAEDDELVVVCDGFDKLRLSKYLGDYKDIAKDIGSYDSVVFEVPWRVGCAAAWNIGIGLADNELCLMMGSDDRLLEGALDAVREAYQKRPDIYGFYNLPCVTSEGEEIGIHNNAAAVTRSLWDRIGGFPLEASLGAPDALVISIMLRHYKEHLHQVSNIPLYWVREHAEQDGKKMYDRWLTQTLEIRDKMTREWKDGSS